MAMLQVAAHGHSVKVAAPRRSCLIHTTVQLRPLPKRIHLSARKSAGRSVSRTQTLRCLPQHIDIGSPEESDYDLLSKSVENLSAELTESLQGTNIYLVGLMGTGKSTVGKILSYCLKYCFFDTDEIIEKYHQGQPVAKIFQEEGEEYFRSCETEVLKQLSPYKRCIIATGGGIVEKPENWSYLQHGVVVWLDGPSNLLAMRVVADGAERRPLLAAVASEDSGKSPVEATADKLDAIMQRRKDKYSNADIKVSLVGTGLDANRGAPPPVVNFRIMSALSKKIKETAQERADMASFTIEGLDDLPTSMKVVPPAS